MPPLPGAIAGLAALVLLAAPAPPAEAQLLGGLLCDATSQRIPFVTVYDPDGPGPAPSQAPRVHQVRATVGNVLGVPVPVDQLCETQIDVGHTAAKDLAVSIGAPLGTGGPDEQRPTIKIRKIASHPLPVRIEAVDGSLGDPAAEKQTFGYDARRASAPSRVIAAIDLRDRDGIPETEQARLELDINGPGKELGIVNETFTGSAAGTRTEVHSRRLDYRSDPDRQTSVPHEATVDFTGSDDRQRVELTRDLRTTLDFEISEPGGDPRTRGTVDTLPSALDVSVADEDTDADGDEEKVIHYEATNRAGLAEVNVSDGPRTTAARVENAPRVADIVYSSAEGGGSAHYEADERADRARVDIAEGDLRTTATLEHVPTLLDVDYATSAAGGTVDYSSDVKADRAAVEVDEGARSIEGELNGVPTQIGLDYAQSSGDWDVTYDANDTTPEAVVTLVERPASGRTRTIATTVDNLPDHVELDFTEEPGTIDYSGSAAIPEVRVEGTDTDEPFFERAKWFLARAEQVPGAVHAEFGGGTGGDLVLDALGEKIGLVEFTGRDTPPDPGAGGDCPDPCEDGVVLEDEPSHYLLSARVHDLRLAEVSTDPDVDVRLDTVPEQSLELQPCELPPLGLCPALVADYRPFGVTLRYPRSDNDELQELGGRIDGLRPDTRLLFMTEEDNPTLVTNLLQYSHDAPGQGPTITLDGSNLESLPKGEAGVQTDQLNVRLEGVPEILAAGWGSADDDPLFANAAGSDDDVLDRGEVQITSGPDQRLREEVDGVLLRDVADRHVIFGRIRGLESFFFKRPDDNTTEATLRADAGRTLEVDSVKDVEDVVWEEIVDGTVHRTARPGTDELFVSAGDRPSMMDVEIESRPGQLNAAYDGSEARGGLVMTRNVSYRGGNVPVKYFGDEFVQERLPASYPASDFDSRQVANLSPLPESLRICQAASGNDCTEDVFTDEDPDMFDEFSSESANGGSVRLLASPRVELTYHDDSAALTEFRYMREDACFEGPIDFCFPFPGAKPGRATTTIDGLSLREFSTQSHQEDSGFVGDLIGYPDQGYVAMHTGWTNPDSVEGEELCEALGLSPDLCTGTSPLAFAHGHRPPPADARLTGGIRKGGRLKLDSELGDPWEDEFEGISRVGDDVNLDFGPAFAAEHRIFEGDPDELIFAKTWNGHVYCDAETTLVGNGSSFKDNFCDGEFALPPEE